MFLIMILLVLFDSARISCMQENKIHTQKVKIGEYLSQIDSILRAILKFTLNIESIQEIFKNSLRSVST